jgi:Zn-dependent peptidase ImmA (M78 family)
MSTEELLSFAENHGRMIYYMNLKDVKAVTLDYDGSFIALSKALHGVEEKEIAAHELGHCEYGGTYKRRSPFEISAKAERRADKWAYHKLVPPGELREAFKMGVVEAWELAERFEVSDEYIHKALMYYREIGLI